MIFFKNIIGIAEIAETLDVNKNVVSNWISRDKKFPAPYIKNAAGPLWRSEDIVEYVKTRGFEAVALPETQGKTGTMVILGRARLGKSFLISIFTKSRKEYADIFCSNGKDKTVCPIQNIFLDTDFKEYIEFHSNFNSIYESEESDVEIQTLKASVSSVLKKHYDLKDGNSKNEIKHIEDIIRKIREIEQNMSDKEKSDTYISVYLQPSNFLRDIMRKSSLKRLEIMDTPGVSGNVAATKLSKADLYIIILKPDNNEEAKTLDRIVKELKPYTASSKVIFMFKKESIILTKKKYDQKCKEAKESIAEFEDLFRELKGCIINTDSEILNLAKNTVMFPTMDEEDVTLAEELFQEELYDRFLAAFKVDEAEKQEKARFMNIVKQHGKEAVDYVLQLLKGIPNHILGNHQNTYTLEMFRNEKHDRVMTADNYRIRQSLNRVYQKEVELLNAYFSTFTANNVFDEWKQDIIRYLYRIIFLGSRECRGRVGVQVAERLR